MWPPCFFFQAEDGIRDDLVTGVQTCALPITEPWIPIRLPSHGLGTGRLQHPFADGANQAGFLCQRDELCGRNEATLWMLPSQKSLSTAEPAGLARNNGVIVNGQPVGLDGPS